MRGQLCLSSLVPKTIFPHKFTLCLLVVCRGRVVEGQWGGYSTGCVVHVDVHGE